MTTSASTTCLSMDRWKGRVALVTGASAGIGKATTIRLLQHGLQVSLQHPKNI